MKPVAGLELELALLGQALLAGVGLCLVYDVIRVIRRIFPHGILWISLEDVLFGLVTGGWLFLKVCQVNNGIIRGYMILGIGAGALLYRVSAGRLLMSAFTKCILVVKKRLKSMTKAVTIRLERRLEKLHRNQETENEEEKKKTP